MIIKVGGSMKKIDTPNNGDSCPQCDCLYDDKMKGGQGRNGACECNCDHRSINHPSVRQY